MLSNEEVSSWLQKLADTDASERRIAAEALAAADERAVYPLIRALRDENTGVQDAAMRSIIAIGGEATAYMTLPLLRENPFLRNTARIILRQIGKSVVPLLRPLLSDKDDDVRTFALDLISDLGDCDYPDEIVQVLKADPNQNVRTSAARALGALGHRDAVPVLVSALKDNEWVSFSALESLSILGDESCVDAILAVMEGPSETLRYAAIEALGKIRSARAGSALIRRLPESNDIEKAAIVGSLVRIGVTPAMAEVGDLLINMFTRGEWEDRLIALTGLADLRDTRSIPVILDVAGSLDPSDPESEERLILVKQALTRFGCAPALLSVLSDRAVKFRGKTIALEVIGELQCKEAIPDLITLMDGDLREVRRASVLALAEIGGQAAQQELRKRINDRDGHVRRGAISALGRAGDKDSFTAILSHLEVENYKDVLEETVQALLRIDSTMLFSLREKLSPEVKEVMARAGGGIDALLALSRDPVPGVRLAALAGLGRFQDERAKERLIAALHDPNAETRKTAIDALGALNCCGDELKRALGDQDLRVRIAAIKALTGFRGTEATKAIIPLLYDTEAPVVLAAIEALVLAGNAEAVKLGALQNHQDPAIKARVAEIMGSLC